MSTQTNILLVDDDPDIGLALSDYLHQDGFTVEVALTAHEALQKTLEHAYDVVLLDIGLPDRGGVEVLDELSNQHPHVPVILLTAFTSLQKSENSSILNKAFAYLTKPYNRLEVKKTIQRALGVRSSGTQIRAAGTSENEDIVALLPFKALPSTQKAGEPQSFNLQHYERLVQYVQIMQFACDHAADPIFVAGPDKRFYFANKAACKSLGYTRDELLALRIPDVAPQHDSAHYRQRLEILQQGQSVTYESVHRTKDGREFPIDISLNIMNFHGQQYTCAVTRTRPPAEHPSDPSGKKGTSSSK